MTVVVHLIGGLGNQFFQYAVGRALAAKHSTALKLDTSPFENYQLRTYALRHYCIEATELSESEHTEFGLRPEPATRIGRLVERVFGARSIALVRESGFEFDPSILRSTVPCYLQGFWQSPKYFASIDPMIRKELTLREPLAGENLAAADRIAASLAVSVHVRRGDYANSESTNQYHGTCSPEYYLAAEALLRGKLGDPTLYIFSDDPDWAAQNLRFKSPTVILRHNGPERDYEDLRLMTLCQHHIIANSTFSWWGAWLCANPGKTVVAPRNWFRDARHSTSDLIPEEWIRV